TFKVLPLYDIETFYVCADSLAARGLNEKIPVVLDVTILTSSALREQLSHYDTVLTF
ncbi:DsrE family protein, partial [Klebsiella pneumoniae]|nr:DsrE family protein [Klebsiella pneumoniae]